jgi:hypothetical protein
MQGSNALEQIVGAGQLKELVLVWVLAIAQQAERYSWQ